MKCPDCQSKLFRMDDGSILCPLHGLMEIEITKKGKRLAELMNKHPEWSLKQVINKIEMEMN